MSVASKFQPPKTLLIIFDVTTGSEIRRVVTCSSMLRDAVTKYFLERKTLGKQIEIGKPPRCFEWDQKDFDDKTPALIEWYKTPDGDRWKASNVNELLNIVSMMEKEGQTLIA